MELGIFFAFVALIGWGCGDFFLQRVTRIMGAHQALFCTCAVGSVVLLPFVWHELSAVSADEYRAFLTLGGIGFVGAIVLLEAFRRGKLSVVESVVAFEIPFAVALGVFVGGEVLTFGQIILLIVICGGVLFAAAARLDHLHYHKRIFERGVVFAFASALIAALVDFTIGEYTENISPLFLIWGMALVVALLCGGWMVVRGELRVFWRAVRKHPKLVAAECAFDNAGWLGYAFATSMMPMSITISIAGSYIALAAFLGLIIGREKLGRHQVAGALVAFIGVGLLAATI